MLSTQILLQKLLKKDMLSRFLGHLKRQVKRPQHVFERTLRFCEHKNREEITATGLSRVGMVMGSFKFCWTRGLYFFFYNLIK